MRRILKLTLILLLSASGLVAQDRPIRMGRHPAPSPDGRTLVFSYQGDLWSVPIEGGRAIRLTVHEACDRLPVWSPDGKEIAFSSNRFGNDDIFVIPAGGGPPTRLTFFSNPDRLCDWTPDGENLIFSSRRNFYYHRLPVIYQVSRQGGTPTTFMPEYADQGKISPDGNWLVFVKGRIDWWRKHYRGSGDTDILLYNLKTGEYRQLTTHPGRDLFPMWSSDGKSIFYVTDEDGTYNIWQMDLTGKKLRQLTFHKGDGVRFPSISRNGKIIAYEQGTDIWTVSTAGGKPKRVEIFAPSDYKQNLIERKTFTKDATEMKVSPDGEQIAFVVRGEIFVMKIKEKDGKATRLTDNPARDFDIAWAPNSDTLVFVSDRNGNQDLFLVYSDDPKEKRLYKSLRHKIVQLTRSPDREHSPLFSPDGEKIAYVRGNGDLYVMDKDGKNARCILKGWATPHYSWSPDSKWIAFSRPDNEFNHDVFIIPAEGGEPVNITRHPDNDMDPVWSEDGRKLGFISRRVGDTYDIWFVFLQKKDHEKTKEEWEEEEEREKKKKDEEKEKKKEKVEVKIDFKDIHRRLRRVTSLPGKEVNLAISPDGKTFAFASNIEGKNDLWTVKWDGTELKQLTQGGTDPSAITWSRDGKKIYFIKKGGTFQFVTADGKESKAIPFKARMTIDHRAERLQMFDEAWGALNDNFYDPNFHGVDWKAMKRKYRPIAAEVVDREDFYDVIRLMLGELNSSHLGIYGPKDPNAVVTGMLGLRFDESYKGKGLKVRSVLPDGPCDKEEARVRPGEILVAIDGVPIQEHTNIHEILNDKVGERVLLEIIGLPPKKEKRSIVVRPINYNEFLKKEYDRWVKEKRSWVDRESKGKIGYLHIQAMGMSSLERFEMELYSVAHGKEGLIIDVRNNPGGWTTDYLLAILSPKPHAITVPRGGGKGYPQDRRPLYAWSKPIVVLCNQYSYSNAEIFSHAIKTLKRGKVIGVPTPGAVISTGGIKLIDGSWFRIPFRGWYVEGSGLNMEGNGCVPDIIVEDQPGDVAKGIDRQLEKALEVILEEIRARK